MNEIKKVSEITASDVIEYLRLNEADASVGEINTYLSVAKNSIASYTGIPIVAPTGVTDAESLDDYPDLVIAVFLLCQDFYDNRGLYVDKKELNQTVQTILNMHTRNLI